MLVNILRGECCSEISGKVTFNVDCCQIVYDVIICDFYRGDGKVGNRRGNNESDRERGTYTCVGYLYLHMVVYRMLQ